MEAKEIVCSDFSDDDDLDFSDDDLDAMNLEELKAFYKRSVQRDNKVFAELEQGLAILVKDTARLIKKRDKKKETMLRKRKYTEKLRAHVAVLEEFKALSAKKVKTDKDLAKLKELKEGNATLRKLTASEAGAGKSEKEMSTALPKLKPVLET